MKKPSVCTRTVHLRRTWGVLIHATLGLAAATALAAPPTRLDAVAKAGPQAARKPTAPVKPSAAGKVEVKIEPKKPGEAKPEAKPSSDVVPVIPAAPALASIPTARFCPTSGRVEPLGPFALKVDMGGMRGVVAGDNSATAELTFTYRGPSSTTTPLADGTVRRQIGLRLRAQDTCNAIYVMWHVAPAPRIAISVKRNAGMSTHAQCLDRGYINLRPTSEAAPAPIEVGKRRTLRAEIDGSILRVKSDGVVVWQGPLPPEANAFAGPAGIRSDNGTFDFELRVPDGTRGQLGCAGVVRD